MDKGEEEGVESSIDRPCRGSDVPLRALWCNARGGSSRLRHATERVKKEKKQEKEV